MTRRLEIVQAAELVVKAVATALDLRAPLARRRRARESAVVVFAP
ncbi:MAG TPA: hypothetical protein PK156_40840 [Polyangium sp.]|nr:hypothetical protein [Polyangium sp.]